MNYEDLVNPKEMFKKTAEHLSKLGLVRLFPILLAVMTGMSRAVICRRLLLLSVSRLISTRGGCKYRRYYRTYDKNERSHKTSKNECSKLLHQQSPQ
jgi:hypothetical protein